MILKLKHNVLLSLAVLAILLLTVNSSFAETVQYQYDDLNRLERVIYENGDVIDYYYDEVGNRNQKTTTATILPITSLGTLYSGIAGTSITLDASGSDSSNRNDK